MPETKEQKVVRLAEQGVERALSERRPFTITKLGRHEDGYLHAHITPSGRSKYVYVHRRFGSWMAPGKIKGREVMKELESFGLPSAAKVELQRKARALERREREIADAAIRDEAVRIVDERHGYTVEFSSSPEQHRAEYDEVEADLRKTKGITDAPDTGAEADAGTSDAPDV